MAWSDVAWFGVEVGGWCYPGSVSVDTVRCNIKSSAGEASPQKQLWFILTSVKQSPIVPFTEKLF